MRECPVCGDVRREEELCGLEDRVFGAAPGKWTLQRCLNCRSAYLDPRPDRLTIGLAYNNYYTHVAPSTFKPGSAVEWIRNSVGNAYRNRLLGTRLRPSFGLAWIIAPLLPAAARRIQMEGRGLSGLQACERRVLDVGCGNGEFLTVARQMGWRCYGVEIDSNAADIARRHGFEIVGAQLSDLGPEHDGRFDAVTLSHVIEHVHDPNDTLRRCWRVLKPGAYIWIQTPNLDSVGYEIYGRFWRGLEPPRHLTIFNPASLHISLESAGFERIRILPTPPRLIARYTFTQSARMQAGQIAAINSEPFPWQVRRHIRSCVYKAATIVRNNPERSEFITIEGYRPNLSPNDAA